MFRLQKLAFTALAVAFAILAILITVLAVPGAWLLVVIFITFYRQLFLALAALVCLGLISLCWRRSWALLAGVLAGTVSAILLSTLPTPAHSFTRWAADLADVAYYRADLQRLAEESRRNGESPALGVLPLDGFGSLTSGLAVDPSGEILLPAARRSAAWTTVASHTEAGLDSMSAQHIVGDYYAWSHD